MSGEPETSTVLERSGYFRPRTFLAGLAAGLALCSVVARVVSHRGYHPTFTRFHQSISPEAQYYPTLDEMCGIVRTHCRPDQVLVIVGGNSVFNGVGQPAEKMWTVELQRRLGERFAVINFAFRGALCTEGGAVVAEALRKEFPRQVYVANSAPFSLPVPFGHEPYNYLFWEASDWGRLERFAPRDDQTGEFLSQEYTLGRRFDIWGRDWLDRGLRFRDLWNWVGYEYFFTIQSPITPDLPEAVWARKRFPDAEPDFETMTMAEKYRPENRQAEMAIVRGFSDSYYRKDKAGTWRLRPSVRIEFERVAKAAFPDDLKARTLIMLSRNNPYYVKQLSPDELLRENAAYADCEREWRKEGYESGDYGAAYEVADFGDRTHLSASGGRKLAAQVAQEVVEMARKRGYTQGGDSRP